jgi:hemerythrin
MTLIKWTEEFRLGIDQVDAEHKALIELINGLYDVMQVGADYVQIVEILGEIYSQIAVHFAHEEDLMRESGYTRYEEHREDHETLLDDLREIMDEVEADGSFDEIELSSDLNRWFVDHFRTHDAKLYKVRPG